MKRLIGLIAVGWFMAGCSADPVSSDLRVGEPMMVYGESDGHAALVEIRDGYERRRAFLSAGTRVSVLADDQRTHDDDDGYREVQVHIEDGTQAGSSGGLLRRNLRPDTR